MFEDYTYENLMDEALETAEDAGIDTRQGSVFYDAIEATINAIAQLFASADIIFEQSSLLTATGENLDTLASNMYIGSISRETAEKAVYSLTLTPASGTAISVDELEEGAYFSVDDMTFALHITDDGDYQLIAYDYDTEYNNVASGTAAYPEETINNLASAVVGELITEARDEESDDDFRTRIQEMLAAPIGNGNLQQYKTWCEEIEGVGKAIIYPLFAGPNTVKAVLTSSDNSTVASDVVESVQDYIDPINEGLTVTVDDVEYTVGDGIGDGVAPLGAHFVAVSVKEQEITIELTIDIDSSYDSETVISTIESNITEYFGELASELSSDGNLVIKYIKLQSIVASVDGVNDMTSISINGTTESLELDADCIPVLSELTVT